MDCYTVKNTLTRTQLTYLPLRGLYVCAFPYAGSIGSGSTADMTCADEDDDEMPALKDDYESDEDEEVPEV